MRAFALTFVSLLSAGQCFAGIITDTFTPANPELFTINFGAVTLTDGTQFGAFTFKFTFNYALPQSNYPNSFTFKMDNSELNPNTSSAFAPPPITVISAPTFNATNVQTGDKTTWTFDAAKSFLTLSSTSVQIGVDYDPPITSAIFQLNPNGDTIFIPTLENTQVTDNNNNSVSDNSTTLVETALPEPGTLGLLGAGLALLLSRVRRMAS